MLDLSGEFDQPTTDAPVFTGPRPGMGSIVGKGIMRGGVRAATFGAMVGGALAPAETVSRDDDSDRILPRKEDFYRFIDDTLEPAERYWSDDPATLTTAGKIVSALSELPLQLVGGVPTIVGTATASTGKQLLDAGVSPTAAGITAAATGAVTAGMVALPQAGRTLKETMALVAANPLMGAAQDYATATGLEAAGYADAAAMFDPLDPTARTVDTVLGAVFGGAAHYGRWKATAPAEVADAIDTVTRHQQAREANPFAPGTPEAKAHLDAMGKALDDLDNHRPVDVTEIVHSRYGTGQLKADLVERFNLTDEQAADLVTATVVRRAAVRGMDPDAWLGERLAGTKEGTADAYGALYQSAWHGSPHDFDQFSIDKIGTGEGAQVYGHGLYFAGNREVAEYYKRSVSESKTRFERDGVGHSFDNMRQQIADHIYSNSDLTKSKSYAIADDIATARFDDIDPRDIIPFEVSQAVKNAYLEGIEKAGEYNRIGHHGRIYKVELAPADDEYLLWDKPLSEQSAKVRAALRKVDKGMLQESLQPFENTRGDGLYRAAVRDAGNPQAASDYLHSLGIRGIKYLDGSSRGKGEGDYNFVIFNDADVEIVDKLFQGEKGAISWQEDGRAVLHALEAPDFSTAVHELAHLLEADLTATERKQFDRWMHSQVPGAKWSTGQRETFARAFERYLAEGQAPVPELQGVFAKFRDWMLSIYRAIAGSDIDVKLNEQTRAAFDRMLFADLMRRQPTPEVAEARAIAADVARELEEEHGEEWGGILEKAGSRERGEGGAGTVQDSPAPMLNLGGGPADILNVFSRNPGRVAPFLADSLLAEARALEESAVERVVIDGHAKQASVSTSPQWFQEKNRSRRELQATGQGKDSTVAALRKAAAGQWDRLTPGQQDMVLSAVDDIARRVDAFARDIDALELQVGDRFTTTSLEPRVVVGERQGRLLLDNGEAIPMDQVLRVIGDIDPSGRDAAAAETPVDIILRERGDFEFDDPQEGGIMRRSAKEALAEARDAVVIERNRGYLYKQAAVCLGLG